MKITIRSRLLIIVGTVFYGDPQAWGLPCTKEEFYAMPNERSRINQESRAYPVTLHARNILDWHSSYRNVLVDRVRQRVFKNMAICACVGSLAIFAGGMLSVAALQKTIEMGSRVKTSIAEKLADSSKNKKRIEEIQKEAKALAARAKAGEITKEEFDPQAKALQEEFKQLTEAK